MNFIKRIVKSKSFNRFKTGKDMNENGYPAGFEDEGLYDLSHLNNRLIHFFDPKGLVTKAKQHTNAHNYDFTIQHRYLLDRL